MAIKVKKIRIQCPGCTWASRPNEYEKAEKEYVQHLLDCHYGALYCVFCNVPFPDFKTLASHVQNQCQKKRVVPGGLKRHTDLGPMTNSTKNILAAQLCHGLVQLESRFGRKTD